MLVPTRELANQAAESLAPIARMRGLKVAPIYGGVPIRRHAEWLRMGIDIVIATPGRLNDLIERGEVSLADVATVVVDEADQMADMGFMPQVRFALDQVTGPHQTMLFSATLDGEVDKLVRRYQNDPITLEVEINADQIEAVSQRFIAVQDHEKVAVAADIVAGPERSLLFVRTQRGADRLGQQLERLGIRAGVLHGGISQGQRERTLRAFAQGHAPVLVATNVAARGLHVDDVNIVVHYDPPEEDKVFVHRSGRTARAGASGVVVTLVLWDQLRDVDSLRARAGIRETIVGMSPGDPRLADLAAWEPPLEDVVPPAPASVSFQRRGGGGQRGGGYGGRRGAPVRRR